MREDREINYANEIWRGEKVAEWNSIKLQSLFLYSAAAEFSSIKTPIAF